MLENLHKSHHHIRHNLERSYEKRREYHDRNAKPVNMSVGEIKVVRDPTTEAARNHQNYNLIGNHFIALLRL